MEIMLPLGPVEVHLEGDVLVISRIPSTWSVELGDFEPGTFCHEGDTLRCEGTGAIEFWGAEWGYSHLLWGEAGLWGPSPEGMVMLLPRS